MLKADTLVSFGVWLTRVLVYIGLFVGVGGVFFLAWITLARPRPRPIRLVIAAVFVAGPCGGCALGRLPGAGRARSARRGALKKPVWVGGLDTPYGPTAVMAVLALVCGFFSLVVPKVWQARSLSLLGLIGVGGALTASGHASTAEPQWLMRPSVFFHVIGLVFWIGALCPLMIVLHAKGPVGGAAQVVRRFSAAIAPILPVVILAGVAFRSRDPAVGRCASMCS